MASLGSCLGRPGKVCACDTMPQKHAKHGAPCAMEGMSSCDSSVEVHSPSCLPGRPRTDYARS